MRVVTDDGLAGRGVFGWVVVELGEPDVDRLEIFGEAAGAVMIDGPAELALGVQALGRAGEGDRAAQVAHGEVRGDGYNWLVEFKLTTIANAFFKKEPDV